MGTCLALVLPRTDHNGAVYLVQSIIGAIYFFVLIRVRQVNGRGSYEEVLGVEGFSSCSRHGGGRKVRKDSLSVSPPFTWTHANAKEMRKEIRNGTDDETEGVMGDRGETSAWTWERDGDPLTNQRMRNAIQTNPPRRFGGCHRHSAMDQPNLGHSFYVKSIHSHVLAQLE